MKYDSKMNARGGHLVSALSLVTCVLSAGVALGQNTERPVKMKDLPPTVQTTVREQSKGRILLVESIKKNDAIVAYEAHVRTAGKISEIKVDPDGKPVAQ